LNARLGPRRLLDLALRLGPWGSGFRPFCGGLDLGKLEAAPHGLDLGPLEPCLPERLQTSNGRIELAPELFVNDVQRLWRWMDQRPPADTFVLIGRRHLRSNNSWMHNCRRLMGGKERCTLLMHPDDAARLGLDHGQRVAVSSRTGRI
jgi:anaerobic selenocysteine-containing dehydrogenase